MLYDSSVRQLGRCICYMKNKDSLVALLSELWKHIAPRRRMQLAVVLGLMIIATVTELLSIGALLPFLGVLTSPDRLFGHPWFKPIISQFNLTEPNQLIIPITVIFMAAVLLSGVMRLLLMWGQTRVSFAIGADLGVEIYRRTLYQPYAIHAARNSSEVISGVINKANSIVSSTIHPILTLITSVFILISMMAFLALIDPMVSFVVFVGFGGMYALIIRSTKRTLALNSERVTREQNQVIKALQEGLGGIRDVLLDGTQEAYCRIFKNADIPLRRSTANIQIIGASPRFLIEALGMMLIAALAVAMTGRPGGLETVIPVLGTLALGAQRMLPLLQQGYQNIVWLRGGRASLKDALDLLQQPLPVAGQNNLSVSMPFLQQISMHSLYFRYGPQTPWVLQGIDLKISRGSRVGFIGMTGSGKSTLLDIAMGLLTPSMGMLCIDGKVITESNCRAWQAHIAHVPQAIYLSDASIAENIAFGEMPENMDHGRIREAARRAQIADTIEAWEHGYNTYVGERGIRLSGGQRQRIGIARALYKRADVIVFDEATSALDNETEQSVMQAIDELSGELTILIVAHRLTTLRNCSQVVEMEDGVIKRVGSYAEIVGNPDTAQ